MSVKIRYVENKDFTTSIYLDIYQNGKRYKEFLKDLKEVYRATTLDLKGAFRSKRDWPTMLGQLRVVFGERIQESAI